MNELHLFAGAGGGILGGILLGHTCVCAVEIEPYCRKVLLQRQRDKILPAFPIWDDVRTFKGGPWKGKVDAICAGIPCQRVSSAGSGGGFIESDYYSSFKRIVCEVGPSIVWMENSPLLTSRGLGCVLWDLAELGFNAKWGVLGAYHAGAPHKRERIWVAAYANGLRWDEVSKRFCCSPRPDRNGNYISEQGVDSNANRNRLQRRGLSGIVNEPSNKQQAWGSTSRMADSGPWRKCGDQNAPRVLGVANGVANRVDRLKAIGNGQVPSVVVLAWQALVGNISE